MKIAGMRSDTDWQARKASLKPGESPEEWARAFDDFFVERLKTRYFDPIEKIRELKKDLGEGFAIVAIQCSLIEFLGAIRTGQAYVHRSELNGRKKTDQEYTSSGGMFISFLTDNAPFSRVFTTKALAEDFYYGVRCALLHEARTKHGWRILAKDRSQRFVDVSTKTVYRDHLHDAFLSHIDRYRNEIQGDASLQRAFVQKFDALCRP